jgi:hypothetical protein
MQLSVGERLEGAGPEQQPGGYVVTGVVRETPWYGLYAAKKVFYNFDFTAKRVRETDEKEWLDVYLRTIRYPVLDQADYVEHRRELARSELRAILGSRHSNLWPEPIDLLEVENTRDPFAFVADGRDQEPVVAFARPHGLFLPVWLEQLLPLASVQAVLAELLEFVSQAHGEGLLLLGLSPDAIVVDSLERVHYVGTDTALSQQSPVLTDAAPEAWGRLFPPERFAPGFAAPECLQPGGRPDPRSDLYSWACLCYALVTGDSPARLAQEQGRPWALFQEAHFARLHKALADLPPGVLGPWAEQLGVAPAALLQDWPRHFVEGMRLLLSPNPSRRPRSVAELRSWLVSPPPAGVTALAPLQQEPGEAKLLLDCSALEAGLNVRIHRGRGTAPTGPEDGEPIYDGPPRPFVIDGDLPLTPEPEPIWYTAWAAKVVGEHTVYSPGLSEALWQPSPANLRRWAEQQAIGHDRHPYPPRAAMVLGAVDPVEAAEALLRSASARARGWGLRRLEQALRAGLRFSMAEPLLWDYLADPVATIRRDAAMAVWNHSEWRGDDLLLRLLEALEAPPVDSATPLAEFLRQLGLTDERVAQLLQTLEHRRPFTCPRCGQPMPVGERAEHLRAAHGYVDYDGDVLPYGDAVERLWERVLFRQDAGAHERLLELYQRLTPPGRDAPPGLDGYAADLEKQTAGQAPAGLPVALPFTAVEGYRTILRQSGQFFPIVRLLLVEGSPRLREVAREALLPALAERLRSDGAAPPAEAIERALEEVCPGPELAEERLRLCGRLPAFGVSPEAIAACAARLREDRIVNCAECGARVRSKDIETHLRRAHGIFEFRGVRRTFEETREVLLRAVCATPPDLKAWEGLLTLVEERYPREPDRHLVGWLHRHLRTLEGERRGPAVVGLAEVLAIGERARTILPLLVAPGKSPSWEHLARRVALELAARLPPPVAPEVVAAAKPLLADKELPRKARQRAAASLLRTTGKAGPAAVELLRAYVDGAGKLRAIEKLHQLEQRFGQAPAIDQLCQELEDLVRMSCPRCPTQLRKKEMVRHLWDRHRLVLDGQRVREPWRLLEDWAVDYGLEKDPDLLKRCRDLARQVDPEGGLPRLQRLMIRHGIEEGGVLDELAAQARARRSGLCPYCYSFVPAADPEPPDPLTIEGKELEGGGYRVEVSDRGLMPTVRVDSPYDEVLYAGREPGSHLTRLGAVVFVGLPLVVLLFAGLEVATLARFPAVLIALLACGVGLILSGLLYSVWPGPRPARPRLVRAAWDLLVPDILDEPLNRAEWELLYGLARLGREPGLPLPGMDLLTECCEAVGKSGRVEPLAARCLAELSRLYVEELRDAGQDAVSYLADQLGACFEGRASLLLFRQLVRHLSATRKDWTRGEVQRLRVLLAARAYESGLGIDDVLDLGRLDPAAKSLLGLEDRWRWGQLELLWSMGPRRAWQGVGPALSVFDLAERAHEAEALLEQYPDLLLSVRKQQLHVTARGVWVLGQMIHAYIPDDRISWEWSEAQRIFLIDVGPHRLRIARGARELVVELKAWLKFYFRDFLPRFPTARRPTTEAGQKMWQTLRAACPECGRAMVPCVGEVGIPLRT